MPRTILAVSLVVLVSSLSLLGCGGGDDGSSQTERAAVADDAAAGDGAEGGAQEEAIAAGQAADAEEEGVTMAFQISTPAFADGKAIPKAFSCEGEDRSPALIWDGVPEGTQTFALVCDDPDAPSGTWVHWTVFNIPGSVTGLPENAGAGEGLPEGAIEGGNSWGRAGYGGPCPPPGKPHRYFFKVYALDGALDLDPQADKGELLAAMEGHILAEAQTMGTYRR